jgi:hypothetical protein
VGTACGREVDLQCTQQVRPKDLVRKLVEERILLIDLVEPRKGGRRNEPEPVIP